MTRMPERKTPTKVPTMHINWSCRTVYRNSAVGGPFPNSLGMAAGDNYHRRLGGILQVTYIQSEDSDQCRWSLMRNWEGNIFLMVVADQQNSPRALTPELSWYLRGLEPKARRRLSNSGGVHISGIGLAYLNVTVGWDTYLRVQCRDEYCRSTHQQPLCTKTANNNVSAPAFAPRRGTFKFLISLLGGALYFGLTICQGICSVIWTRVLETCSDWEGGRLS